MQDLALICESGTDLQHMLDIVSASTYTVDCMNSTL